MNFKKYFTNPNLSTMILGAHSDDAELSCSGLINRTLQNNSQIFVIYATNGAPFDESYYPRFGISNAADYVKLRKKESLEALSLLGVDEANADFLNIPDQKLFESIDNVSNSIALSIEKQKPLLLFSPAYEGGHPDHDALRFIAEIAVKKSRHKPLLCEYPEYNYYNGTKNYFKFINSSNEPIEFTLTREESDIKKRIFQYFKSQQKYILPFLESDILQKEHFRIAPEVDFSKFPHKRPLFYETVNIKITPEEFIDAINKFINHTK